MPTDTKKKIKHKGYVKISTPDLMHISKEVGVVMDINTIPHSEGYLYVVLFPDQKSLYYFREHELEPVPVNFTERKTPVETNEKDLFVIGTIDEKNGFPGICLTNTIITVGIETAEIAATALSLNSRVSCVILKLVPTKKVVFVPSEVKIVTVESK